MSTTTQHEPTHGVATESMPALRWHGRRDLRLEEVPRPRPRAGEVLVAVEWCGICGTDLHEYLEGPIFVATDEHPLTGSRAPVTLGHEFAGQVVELGEGVRGLRVGDRVSSDGVWRCRDCWYCRTGDYHRCESIGFIGLASDGAFAPFVVVPEEAAYVLPDSVTNEQGALVEPIAVAVHAVRRSGMAVGDSVAVVGAGPIGLMTIAVARASGAGEIYVVEPSEARKARAFELGATVVLDPASGDAVAEVRRRTAGARGVDVSFECVGLQATLGTSIDVLRKGGTAAVVGVFEQPIQLDMNDVVLSERMVVGCLSHRNDVPRAIALLADGRIDAELLITSRVDLADVIDEGFGELVRNKDRHVKVLVRAA
jgi:(R,R)-butanediol dehydrogenase / meso-butanediol dehydrogenase / diacetyl reductase